MQKKFGMLLVLVLALSLVFCFAATAWAAGDEATGEDVIEETAAEETAAEEVAAEEEAAEEIVEETGVFTDVPADYWAYDYIMDIFDRKLTTGTSATTFGPEATLTRAQFVTFLGRLAGINAIEHEEHNPGFTDIGDAAVAYAYGYICWAAEIGVTNGTTATTFNPQGQLTREQMATMVLRFAKYYGVAVANEAVGIDDLDSVSSYAAEAVSVLVPNLISLQDGNFNPQGLATRAEMSQVLSLFPVPEDGFVAAPAPEPVEEIVEEDVDPLTEIVEVPDAVNAEDDGQEPEDVGMDAE